MPATFTEHGSRGRRTSPRVQDTNTQTSEEGGITKKRLDKTHAKTDDATAITIIIVRRPPAGYRRQIDNNHAGQNKRG